MSDQNTSEADGTTGAFKVPPLRDPFKPRLPKRFYDKVDILEGEKGCEIALDGKPVRTPLKNLLSFASRPLCEAVAVEWRDQVEHIDPARMPLTRLANTAIDRVATRRDTIIEEIVSYAGSDLLCYRAESPDKLLLRQAQQWDPVVTWAEGVIGARFILTQGVMHHEQPAGTMEKFADLVRNHGDFTLTGIHNITTLTGSALIGAAVAAGEVTAQAAWAAAHVDEDWQIEQWGRDEEADARRAGRQADFEAAVQFIELARG